MRNLFSVLSKFWSYRHVFVIGFVMIFLNSSCKQNGPGEEPDIFQLLKVTADETVLSQGQIVKNISVIADIRIEFSASADTASARNSITLVEANSEDEFPIDLTFENNASHIIVRPADSMDWKRVYEIRIANTLKSEQGADFPGIDYTFETRNGEVEIVSASVNGTSLRSSGEIRNIQFDDIDLRFTFSEALDEQSYQNYFNTAPSFSRNFSLSEDAKTVTITNAESLDYYRYYSININKNLTAANGFEFDGFESTFQTGLDPSPKFPQLSDEQLLDKVQEATFQYFWDFAHPTSGLARERNTSGETVTTGGSGFGLMAIITGISRGFITRSEGITRLQTIVDFLASADRFHGAWAHWMNGSTGDAIAFSTYDDGGDLVETAFMAQGLITVRQFLDENTPAESDLINNINTLLNSIEWDWYTRGGQNVLYWHWSPEHEWQMNMQIKGYNEALIVYVLAASSEDHGIQPEVYHEGWASSGGIENGNSFYGYTLPVGYDYGGPLFFAHYSFLGLDPRNLSDTYADYWIQNRNHTLINREHSIVNPNNFVGYSSDSWGLTASDNPFGYQAHEPTRDNGTITPTAAISSIPYTPEKSMEAMRHFYFTLGDKLWGEYGFHDAFNPTEGWWADSYLAIDQGPIVVMIENHRTGLLWDLFMTAPEVQQALIELGFSTE